MKVLCVHNFYQSSSPSGEDTVFRNEADQLKRRGIEVVTYTKQNDSIGGNQYRLSAALDTIWSLSSYREIKVLVKRERPDIAHFHNIWYLISPSAYYACKDSGIPVVQTLHNFRMFCANGLLLRDGKTCEACIGNISWRGIAYGCYRNSRAYSVPVAASQIIHATKKTWTSAIDTFIALTEFGRRTSIRCGLPGDRIFVKPNFLADPPSPNYSKGDYAIYLGRLSGEKGLDVLLDAAALSKDMTPSPLTIKIIGDGPLRDHLMDTAKSRNLYHVEFLGRKDARQCLQLLSHARFMIMPSICYENFPMAIRESFACGKPVVASRLGSLAEIIRDHHTGVLFEPSNARDLAEKILWMTTNDAACVAMGKHARADFDRNYTEEKNFTTLMEIYTQTLKKNGRTATAQITKEMINNG